MSFHVGQKVVCISTDDGFNHDDGVEDAPWPDCISIGTILTIRSVDLVCVEHYGFVGLLFEEYRDEPTEFRGETYEVPFLANCFRPVIERSTDTGMAILRKVADDAAKRKNLVVTG